MSKLRWNCLDVNQSSDFLNGKHTDAPVFETHDRRLKDGLRGFLSAVWECEGSIVNEERKRRENCLSRTVASLISGTEQYNVSGNHEAFNHCCID